MASGGKGEKILVSVRVRPQNEKEKARNDICDWECVNNTTIICNNNFPERSLFPSTYTFGIRCSEIFIAELTIVEYNIMMLRKQVLKFYR